ncbi:MAG: 50S ribosomal protein L21 [Omnitrophica WOR_2 bacterium RIFCSPHIGHO2_01_FULL_48_9]|nr:MAG: 50S ribosomal protein L21 [Omnitrophica WOR_2 bacterium RIFCSPHIGHO2_02_FULL_48_11]OGX30448.1 MAG: 50S ribosomal protein L21 [Omnitrophica WOR_2 bacterium RIFCSPHIGHO2_01_FULL_48_9]
MQAIVKIGSLQYTITEGDVIEVNRLESQDGKSITLDKILFYSNGKDVRVGQPYLKDVKVTAKVDGHVLGEKLRFHKYRRRKNSAWTKGHRSKLTALTITKIAAN